MYGWDYLQLALGGGEDYCLLLTMSKNVFENVQKKFKEKFKTSLFNIGYVTKKPSKLIYHLNGEIIQGNYTHFSHFQEG
jgi:thiamine-monophosphate kinase